MIVEDTSMIIIRHNTVTHSVNIKTAAIEYYSEGNKCVNLLNRMQKEVQY